MTCYAWHRNHDTLRNFPTMRQRTAELKAQGRVPVFARRSNAATNKLWRDRKYAQRVEVNSVLVHPDAPHGKVHSYNSYGCRGAMCNAARLYYKVTGDMMLPDDVRGGIHPTLDDCATFDIETFVGAYL